MDLEIIRVRDLLAARLVFDGIDRMEGKSGDICECFRQREFPAAGITEHRNPIHITTCESALLPRCFTLSLPRKQGARRLTARNARDTWMWYSWLRIPSRDRQDTSRLAPQEASRQ